MSCFVPSFANRVSFACPHHVASSKTCPTFATTSRPFLSGDNALFKRLKPQFSHKTTSVAIQISMSDTSTSTITRVVSGLLIGGLLIGSFLPLLDGLRNSESNGAETVLDFQLSRVPVFTVTDTTGRPFLSETEDHRLRRGFFFIQPADAEAFLEQVKSDNPDAKVLAVGLDKAAKFLYSKSTPAKSVPEKFELFPDDEQASIARDITDGNFEKTFGKYGVPIFYIDGLAVKDDKVGKAMYPLFFEKAKLDETLKNLKKTDPKTSLSDADLQVIDLSQTIKEIRAGANPRLNQVVFVPLTDSLEQLKVLNARSSP